MATIPDHNAPEVLESEVKVFRQKYFVVDDLEDTGRRTDYQSCEARIEVLADADGVFIESKEGSVTEQLSIPTSDLAIKVAQYVLGVYKEDVAGDPPTKPDESDTYCGLIKFLDPAVQNCVSHELWRLSNHITSPHGPVDAQGAPELYGHLKYLADLLDLEMKPHPKYSEGYKPNYNK